MTSKLVYISSAKFCDEVKIAGTALIKNGFAPIFAHNPTPSVLRKSETVPLDWFKANLCWMEAADAIYKLPGESTNTTMEMAHARQLGIPVYESVEHLKKDFN